MVERVRQTSFSGGELSPMFHARTDAPRYAVALEKCRNAIPIAPGAVVYRPGTLAGLDITERDEDQQPIVGPVRLIALRDGDHLAYWVLGPGWALFQRAGAGYVPQPAPWSAIDLPRLSWAVWGRDVVVACPGVRPHRLTANNLVQPLAWSQVKAPVRPLRNGTDAYFYSPEPARMPLPAAWVVPGWMTQLGVGDLQPGDDVWPGDMPLAESHFHASEGRVGQVWRWAIAAVLEDSGEAGAESAAVLIDHFEQAIYEGGPAFTGNFRLMPLGGDRLILSDRSEPYGVNLAWAPSTGVAVKAWRVYRGTLAAGAQSELDPMQYQWGLVGEVEASALPVQTTQKLAGHSVPGCVVWTDANLDPDYSRAPRRFVDPYATEDWPTCVAHYEQRRIWGGGSVRPSSLEVSCSGAPLDHTRSSPLVASDAMSLTLASQEREQIRAMVPARRLLVLTESGEWIVGGAGGAPLSPVSLVEARRQSGWGASSLPPLQVGASVLWVDASGAVREALFSSEAGGLAVTDLSSVAEHLIRGRRIIGWAHQPRPCSIVWMVLDDGAILSMTFSREQEVCAWARHELGGGMLALDVAAVRGDAEDTVLFAVRHTDSSQEVIELARFSPADGTPIHLDCAASRIAEEPILALPILQRHIGSTVDVVADGVVGRVDVIDETTTLTSPAREVHVGWRYRATVGLLEWASRQRETKGDRTLVRRVGFEVVGARSLLVGETEDSLVPWRERTPAEGYGPEANRTTCAWVAVRARWNEGGRAVLVHDDPLPLTLLAVSREVERGG